MKHPKPIKNSLENLPKYQSDYTGGDWRYPPDDGGAELRTIETELPVIQRDITMLFM